MILNYSESFKKLEAQGLKYNLEQFRLKHSGEENKPPLKAAHFHLAQLLIKLYAKEIRQIGGVDMERPTLKTNSVGLAKMLKCCSRSIQRQLTRLDKAGIIGKNVIRNSAKTSEGKRIYKSYYELFLTDEILHFSEQNNKDFLVTKQHKIEREDLRKGVLKEISKTTKSTSLETINLLNSIKGSGDDLNRSNKNDLERSKKGRKKQETFKADLKGRINPSSEKWRPFFSQLLFFVAELWTYAEQKFYSRLDFVAYSQMLHAKIYFLSQFITEKPKNYEKKFNEIKTALVFRHEYNERKKQFTPLPTVFFNDSNKYGFTRTLAEMKRAKKTEIDKRRYLTDFQDTIKIAQFTNEVVKTYRTDPTLKNFTRACEEMEKRDERFKEVLLKSVI